MLSGVNNERSFIISDYYCMQFRLDGSEKKRRFGGFSGLGLVKCQFRIEKAASTAIERSSSVTQQREDSQGQEK